MSFFHWRDYGAYVSVAQKRRQAEAEIAKLRKKGRAMAPVKIEGRKIATTFWGQSWCTNLERYSDFASRLPRGRSYVLNGLVIDLQIAKGKVTAMVRGSDLYDVEITIAPVTAKRWKSICRECSGTIDSLVELLQGRLAKGVMDRVCREGDGLFPQPSEIKLSCSCPDWADMCKHVAGALYGIGARLDAEPRLLFELRGVDETELVAGADQGAGRLNSAPRNAKVLAEDDVAALFGLEMTESVGSSTAPAVARSRSAPRARTSVQKPGTTKSKPARSRNVAKGTTKAVRRRTPIKRVKLGGTSLLIPGLVGCDRPTSVLIV
jgi:uncharacterized Zn finger protein